MPILGYLPHGGNISSPWVRYSKGEMSRRRYLATPASQISTSVVEVSQGRNIFLLDKQKPTQSYTILPKQSTHVRRKITRPHLLTYESRHILELRDANGVEMATIICLYGI